MPSAMAQNMLRADRTSTSAIATTASGECRDSFAPSPTGHPVLTVQPSVAAPPIDIAESIGSVDPPGRASPITAGDIIRCTQIASRTDDGVTERDDCCPHREQALQSYISESQEENLAEKCIAGNFVDEYGSDTSCLAPERSEAISNGAEEGTDATQSVVTDDQLLNWSVLWALLATSGSNKLTKPQYQSMRVLIDIISGGSALSWKENIVIAPSLPNFTKPVSCLPHYSTLQRTYRPLIMNRMAPRASDVQVHIDRSKAGASASKAHCRVRVIPPSEYARADISTGPVWSQLQSTALSNIEHRTRSPAIPSISTSDCVDIWPLIGS